jgi:hypothetical protein
VIIRSAGQRPVSRIIGSSFLWDPTAIQAKHATGDLLGTSAGASASLTHARFLGFDAKIPRWLRRGALARVGLALLLDCVGSLTAFPALFVVTREDPQAEGM